MRKLGEAFYGRGKALDAALAALPDRGPLEALIGRTVFGGAEGADPAPFATRLLADRDALSAARPAALLAGELPWGAAA
jgi:hypothetical protein